MASVKTGTPTSRRISNAVRIAVLSPSVLVFISAVRLLIIANYDPTTASSIASSIGVVGTLLGTLIPIVPALLPVLVLAFIALRKPLLLLFAGFGTALVSPAYTTLKVAWLATVEQFTTVINALSASNSKLARHALHISWLHDRTSLIVGAMAVAVLVIDYHEKILRSYRSDPTFSVSVTVFLYIVHTVILLIAVFVIDIAFGAIFFFTTTIYHIPSNLNKISAIASQPWLPSENVTLKSGSSFVGYTLNAGDVWQVFLQERDRTIEYFHSEDVVSRTLCQLPETQRVSRAPLIKLINAPVPIVPPCPDES
jgi:hypothetical protein